MEKKATSFRLSEDALRILDALAEKQGVSKTAVLEFMIREKGKDEGVS